MILLSLGCQGGSQVGGDPGSGSGSGPSSSSGQLSGVLRWKGDNSGNGVYAGETTLTTTNVNPGQFGAVGSFHADGLLIAQPLYIANVPMQGGTHNIILLASEHDSVYALDADNLNAAPLWERHYLDAGQGITPMPDNFGGRTALGGEVGITGTPVIDPSTGAAYFVTTYLHNGTVEQWLRSIDIHTGQDYRAGSVLIQASVPGDGKASVNGQIAFDPSVHNQRAGLTEVNGSILVAWASYSDWGVYHGWLMAFDASTLKLQAAFVPTPESQPDDPAGGPADHGGGGGFWQGGAAPSTDAAGNIYLNAADGSFNADNDGANHGDTLLKLHLNSGSFQVVDWFTPSNADCIDVADLELGSGGVTLLPGSAGSNLAVAISKEGRLFLLNTSVLGHHNAGGDNQIPQEFMIGGYTCSDGVAGAAEGPGWNRLYGNLTYWNGNLYAQPSNMVLNQYKFENGTLNPTPIAQSPSASGLRGGNTVVSSNGTQDGILWVYEKSAQGRAVLHAYDATDVSHELWNSNMSGGRDQMGTGVAFSTPVVFNGHVMATSDVTLTAYGLLQ
jgi:hypothetical protein